MKSDANRAESNTDLKEALDTMVQLADDRSMRAGKPAQVDANARPKTIERHALWRAAKAVSTKAHHGIPHCYRARCGTRSDMGQA